MVLSAAGFEIVLAESIVVVSHVEHDLIMNKRQNITGGGGGRDFFAKETVIYSLTHIGAAEAAKVGDKKGYLTSGNTKVLIFF